jgi:hypothetical protein
MFEILVFRIVTIRLYEMLFLPLPDVSRLLTVVVQQCNTIVALLLPTSKQTIMVGVAFSISEVVYRDEKKLRGFNISFSFCKKKFHFFLRHG